MEQQFILRAFQEPIKPIDFEPSQQLLVELYRQRLLREAYCKHLLQENLLKGSPLCFEKGVF
ncbi:MAG: NblA-related protein [Cyanobacteriota bacterium]